ncbi:orotate phosphoribosyltransferase [Candidatus Symbiobacter mobilis]|uniref:Orotate phosphoribosyltransferase n=1 Tax=Candidatus Symbiobacter mobilis CR TaxID=946483 RepID=U5N895_9BURK|nr:orotate phosphoribosyltransferase [Candidatus Symbiobacter mobilis]AGX86488.1 orotate phosphoribosyltransferase [Candidatus Symbiobacter mobilis CR]
MNDATPPAVPDELAQEFVRFALECGVLRFGEFRTKAGRLSPYFFHAALFCDGARLDRLAQFYARRLLEEGVEFDVLFGSAYKGIPLAAALSVELARRGHNKPFAYHRKEAKDHGEGGLLIGAPLQGRVLIVDDVISAGSSVRECVSLIRQAGAIPSALLIALDRQERATEDGVQESAVRFVERSFGMQVVSIARLDDLLDHLRYSHDEVFAGVYDRVLAYRQRYGA